MYLYGWVRVEGLAAEYWQWAPRYEQTELFPGWLPEQTPGVDMGGRGEYLDTEVSVSALPDGRTLYAF